jgi:hypothetical protein
VALVAVSWLTPAATAQSGALVDHLRDPRQPAA